ncbi:Tol-Pal system beta propeller repeat protein TolB [Aquabacterium sp. J223]|uniref:Tol-Pal system beta propeller repeat protein TolB n=1 Tax=Aquabacterium sp. J223 TaxID=2898431 RepID=UPI0021AD8249|nr:Tol-Pal system beta propeller repeat protein TolB [Aquabacterium sp. J223]UUX97889.1 Tol-Pal system beta propeller repeat protein TolB [Aquabacterium sp. J223]
MPRRDCLALFGAGLAAPALAQFRVDISGVGATQLPIAIAPFRDEASGGQPVAAIVRADLERSGVFRGIDAQPGLDELSQPVVADWRNRGADALVVGSVSRLADGRYDVRYKLWDVVRGSDLGGQSYAVAAADLRLAAHRIADAVYERITGEKGVAATRIAYVTRGAGRYTLRVTDADGEGGQVALNSPEPIISPAWAPNGRELAYVSFETQKAVVWVQDVQSGQRRQVANFRGSNSAPAWSPDGSQLAVTLTLGGGSQLYLIGRDGGTPRRITQSSAIDTEPVFSADGKLLYFVSDRGGQPQVYRMPAGGGNAERVTFSGNYNISPSISPDGRQLAYVTRQGNAFKVAVLDLAGGNVSVISDTNDDESPSFAPNGRLLVYATRQGGRDVLMSSTVDGRARRPLVTSGIDMREPVWGPFGR